MLLGCWYERKNSDHYFGQQFVLYLAEYYYKMKSEMQRAHLFREFQYFQKF